MAKKKPQGMNQKLILTVAGVLLFGGLFIGATTWFLKSNSPSVFCEGTDRKDGVYKIFRASPLKTGLVHAQIFKKNANSQEELIFEDKKAGIFIEKNEGQLALRVNDLQQIRVERSCKAQPVCRMENVISPSPDQFRRLQDRLADLNAKLVFAQNTLKEKGTKPKLRKKSSEAAKHLSEIQGEISAVEAKLKNRGVKVEAIPFSVANTSSWCK